MKINIKHQTNYRYDSPTKRSIQLLRVTPQSFANQKVHAWTLKLPCFGQELFDGFGNFCTLLSWTQPHQELCVEAEGEVEIDESLDYVADMRLPPELFLCDTELTQCTGQIRAVASRYLSAGISRSALQDWSADILARMPYQPGSTHVATTAADAFLQSKGVCQDHTHVFLAGARALGVPARYVSGYLYTDDAQHLASHAWAEAWLDGHWYVFDVSNQLFSPSHHVQIAIGRDYNDAAPIRGVRVGGGHERMDYRVEVMSDQ